MTITETTAPAASAVSGTAAGALDDDAVLDAVRDFTARELTGNEAQLDAVGDVPLPLYRRFHEAGLANWWLAPEFGGRGIGLERSVDIVNELSYGDAGAAFSLFISILGTSIVSLYGSPELKERYLTKMAAEGTFCSTLGSEQEAGSELARISTTVSRQSGEAVVTGEKFFSTNSGFADFLVVLGRSAENPAEQLAVLVPRETPGVRIVKRWEMIGLHASGTYQVSLRNCRVPEGNILSGHGLRLLEFGLNASRILIAATAIGVSRRIRDLAMDYAKSKTVRNAPLTAHPVFGLKLAQIETQIEVMLNQCRAAAREYDAIMASPDAAQEFLRRGSLRSALTSKLFCGQAGWSVASAGSELFGGLGFTRESLIEKLMRDMRYVAVVEGGEDVLRDVVYSRYVVPVSKRV
jgi:alkylation response protein AidB-like acyl-CoA dehydrogenase